MTMSLIWLFIVLSAFLAGLINGSMPAVAEAAMTGAGSAVQLCLGIAGPICLWSGILEVLKASGALDMLAKLLGPNNRLLFPAASLDRETLQAISANMSANLLGLGNAATPAGIKAVERMASKSPGIASNDMCTLIVLNTASIQLIPLTVAGIRASLGASAPFDILPAVLLTSLVSVSSGLLAAKIMRHFW